jgi:hypothetical protein
MEHELFVCNVAPDLTESEFEELLMKRYDVEQNSTKLTKQFNDDESPTNTQTGTFIVRSSEEYFEILRNGYLVFFF